MKDFNFFGLQNGNQCLCGNDDSNIIPTHSFECNTRCSGNEEQFCGGLWRVNIYKTLKNTAYSTCKFAIILLIFYKTFLKEIWREFFYIFVCVQICRWHLSLKSITVNICEQSA